MYCIYTMLEIGPLDGGGEKDGEMLEPHGDMWALHNGPARCTVFMCLRRQHDPIHF